MQDLRIFKKFPTLEQANEYAALLRTNNIESIIEPNNRMADSTIIGVDFEKNIQLKIPFAAFEQANRLLEETAKRSIDSIDDSYYLFSFSNKELIEILKKPDEWGKFDFVLAREILSLNGIDVTEEKINEYYRLRMAELARPEDGMNKWAKIGYVFSLLGGFIGIIIGWSLVNARKTLPNGEQVYSYNPYSRKHGKIIYRLGILCLIFFMLIILFSLYKNNIYFA